MAWYITKDKLHEECGGIDSIDQAGQWNGKEETLEEAKQKCKYAFRLLDDDGEVYFHGRSSNNSSFAPLDQFGMPGYGCTEIQYYEDGKWQTL